MSGPVEVDKCDGFTRVFGIGNSGVGIPAKWPRRSKAGYSSSVAGPPHRPFKRVLKQLD